MYWIVYLLVFIQIKFPLISGLSYKKRYHVAVNLIIFSYRDHEAAWISFGHLPRRQYVPRCICQSEDFEIDQIWFCEVVLTMAVGRIYCEC